MRKLQDDRFTLARGISSAFSPLLTGPEQLRDAVNVDTFTEFGALGKIPGSSRQSPDLGAPVDFLRYFQFFGSDGTFRRQVLAAAGGSIYRVEGKNDAIPLKSGLRSEIMSAAATQDKLYMVSPGNDPLKYDGDAVYRWGVRAPGQEEYPIESFDSTAGFSFTGCSGSADSVSRDAGGSVRLDRSSIDANAYLSAQKTISAYDFTIAGNDLAYFWLDLPPGALNRISSIELRLSDGSDTNVYNVEIAVLRESWNFVTIALAVPDSGDADLSQITSMEWRFNLHTNGHLLEGVRLDHFFYGDDGSPEVELSGTGAVDGTVSYVVTYLSKFGQESNAGPPSAAITATGHQIHVKGIPRSPDPQVVSRRLYRDLGGDSLWQLVAQIDNNTATDYLDNVSNEGRATLSAPLAGSDEKDFSPPERMVDVTVWNGMVFGINSDRRFELNQADTPEAWPQTHIRQFDQDLIALIPHAIGLLIVGSDSLVLATGSSWDGLTFEDLHPEKSIGVSGLRAWAQAKRINFQWHDEGPYVNDGVDPWWIGGPIFNFIQDLSPEEFEAIHMAYHRGRFSLCCFARGNEGGEYDQGFIFQNATINQGSISGEGAGIDPKDLRVGAWFRFLPPSGTDYRVSEIVEREAEKPELWVGGGDGYVYRMMDPGSKVWATGKTTDLISAYFVSGWMMVEDRRRTIPRFVNLDIVTDEYVTLTIVVRITDQPNDDDDSGVLVVTRQETLGPGKHSLSVPVGRKVRGEFLQVKVEDPGSTASWFVRDMTVRHRPRTVTS